MYKSLRTLNSSSQTPSTHPHPSAETLKISNLIHNHVYALKYGEPSHKLRPLESKIANFFSALEPTPTHETPSKSDFYTYLKTRVKTLKTQTKKLKCENLSLKEELEENKVAELQRQKLELEGKLAQKDRKVKKVWERVEEVEGEIEREREKASWALAVLIKQTEEELEKKAKR